MAPILYKICPISLWREAERAGVFLGARNDREDGYIHFSTADQAAETASRHFSGARDLVLVAIDAAALGPKLRWEKSRGGALFPHLFAALPLTAVIWAKTLPLGAEGWHLLPDLPYEGE